MKRVFIAMALLAQAVVAEAAPAAPVTVDFGALGINSVDITTTSNPSGLTLNGVTFRYDDFGSGVDFAIADMAGIFGTTGGSLIFDFSAPATALNFDFSLLGDSSNTADALYVDLTNAGSTVSDLLLPVVSNGFDAYGALAYSGGAFDRAQMIFSTDGPIFTVANVSYDSVRTHVPEPGTFALAAYGLFSLGIWRRFERKS